MSLRIYSLDGQTPPNPAGRQAPLVRGGAIVLVSPVSPSEGPGRSWDQGNLGQFFSIL